MQRAPVGRAANRRCPCVITVRRGISAARGELSLARSAAAPGRAQPVRTSAGTRLRRTAAANSGWTLCHSASLRGRCSPLRLPKVAHASAKHTYSGRNTSRTNHRFWRTVNGWSSRRRVGAAGGRSHEGAAQRRARAGRRRCRASVLRTSRSRWQSGNRPAGGSAASPNATPAQADTKLARMLCDHGEPSLGRDGGEPSLGSLEAV